MDRTTAQQILNERLAGRGNLASEVFAVLDALEVGAEAFVDAADRPGSWESGLEAQLRENGLAAVRLEDLNLLRAMQIELRAGALFGR